MTLPPYIIYTAVLGFRADVDGGHDGGRNASLLMAMRSSILCATGIPFSFLSTLSVFFPCNLLPINSDRTPNSIDKKKEIGTLTRMKDIEVASLLFF